MFWWSVIGCFEDYTYHIALDPNVDKLFVCIVRSNRPPPHAFLPGIERITNLVPTKWESVPQFPVLLATSIKTVQSLSKIEPMS